MAGKLYMIGSPIGNLGDITRRAINVLGSLDRLYCEDTRVTGKLLAALGISVSLKSLSDDSSAKSWQNAIDYVNDGHEVGFITDAGMPGLSDPGRKLLQLAWEQCVEMSVIPGPSSVGSLIALCPFIENQFNFMGFAPRKPGEVKKFITQITKSCEPVFFFESPKRFHKLMAQLCITVEPERDILIGRELTKLYEQTTLFTAGDWGTIGDTIPAKGEFTIAIGPCKISDTMKLSDIVEALQRLEEAGFSKRDASRAVALTMSISVNDVKKAAYPD